MNPLEDDSAAFSSLFSGRCSYLQLGHEASPPPPFVKHTNAFPKDKHTGQLEQDDYRRRTKIEEKALWGTELIQFPATPQI